MTLKEAARYLLPPAVLDAVRRLLAPRSRDYSDWRSAASASSQSYSNPELADFIRHRTEGYRLDPMKWGIGPSDLHLVSAIGIAVSRASGRSALTVLDVGGACGAHYFLAKRVFPGVRFDWRVAETEAMVEAARGLASDELSFHLDIDRAAMGAGLDLIKASGVIQYTPDPVSLVKAFYRLRPNVLSLSRTALSSVSPIFRVQSSRLSHNGRGPLPDGFIDCLVQYPIHFARIDEVEQARPSDYSVIYSASENGVSKGIINYSCIVAR